jgi:hypothetical protein
MCLDKRSKVHALSIIPGLRPRPGERRS